MNDRVYECLGFREVSHWASRLLSCWNFQLSYRYHSGFCYTGGNVNLELGQHEHDKGEKASPIRENNAAINWHPDSSIPGSNFFLS